MNIVIAVDVRLPPIRGLIRQRGLAWKYRPHLTIRGRFTLREDVSVGHLRRLLSPILMPLPLIALIGPKSITDRMSWFESERGQQGNKELVTLHRKIGEYLSESGVIGEDLTPPEYQGENYRPHLTAAWGRSSRNIKSTQKQAVNVITVRPVEYSIYHYADTPANSDVTRISIARVLLSE